MADYDFDSQKLVTARGLMSQSEAAKRMGISRQLLDYYEKGGRPSIKVLARIIQVYGIRFDQLISPYTTSKAKVA